VADKIGTVKCLQVADDFAFATIEGGGSRETFILWYFPGTGGGIPTDINAFTRVMHSMWVSLLREARAGNLTVRVVSPSGSAAVSLVQLGTL
jgi:hypothetical protein